MTAWSRSERISSRIVEGALIFGRLSLSRATKRDIYGSYRAVIIETVSQESAWRLRNVPFPVGESSANVHSLPLVRLLKRNREACAKETGASPSCWPTRSWAVGVGRHLMAIREGDSRLRASSARPALARLTRPVTASVQPLHEAQAGHRDLVALEQRLCLHLARLVRVKGDDLRAALQNRTYQRLPPDAQRGFLEISPVAGSGPGRLLLNRRKHERSLV